MLQRILTEFRLINKMRAYYLVEANPPQVSNLGHAIDACVECLDVMCIRLIDKHQFLKLEPGPFFRPEPVQDPIYFSDKTFWETLRANGEILAAMDALKLLLNFEFTQEGSFNPMWQERVKGLEALETDFSIQNRDVLDRRESFGVQIGHIELLTKHICPMLYGGDSVPRRQASLSQGKRDSLGRTPLHGAIDGVTDFAGTSYLHKFINPVDINAQDIFGRTPLHVICSLSTRQLMAGRRSRSGNMVKDQTDTAYTLLTKIPADITLRDCDGMFAVDYAILNHEHRILSMFRDDYKAFDPASEVGTKVLHALRAIEGTGSIPRPLSERMYSVTHASQLARISMEVEYDDDEEGITVDEDEDELEDENGIFHD